MRTALANWNIKSTTSIFSLEYGTIEDQINNGQPVCAIWVYPNGQSHAVLIYGFYHNTDNGNNIRDVYYNDPAYGSASYMDYSWFSGNPNWTWQNSLYNIYV